jgi:hypothetical protein
VPLVDRGDGDRRAARLLLVKGRAGLGNRILGALTGILYSRLSGRRLVVDWRDELYSDDGENVFPRYFRCALAGSTDEIPDTDSVTPAIWRGHLHDTADRVEHASGLGAGEFHRRGSVDLTKLDHPECVAVMWAYRSRALFLMAHHPRAFGRLGRRPPDQLLRRALREDLVPEAAIRERVDELARAAGGEPTIGVHVRLSDRRTDFAAIRRRLEMVLRRERNARIFLSTDNAEIKAMFEQLYPRVVTSPHWYPPPGAPAHRHEDLPDRYEHGADALVDLYALAECDYLIADTTSSFGRVAVLLSHARSSRVSDVSRFERRRRRVGDTLVRVSPRLAHKAGDAYERITARRR